MDVIKTSLSISNISKTDLKILELKMANKRVKGDTIDKYISIKSRSTESYKVKIIYEDESGKNNT